MRGRELYDYIVMNFDLDGASSRLVRNIIEYVGDLGLGNTGDAHAHLEHLLGGAFGINKHEIKLYRTSEEGMT